MSYGSLRAKNAFVFANDCSISNTRFATVADMIDPATILVVDDDEDVLTAARLLLTQHFELVLTCSDPQEIDRHVGEVDSDDEPSGRMM